MADDDQQPVPEVEGEEGNGEPQEGELPVQEEVKEEPKPRVPKVLEPFTDSSEDESAPKANIPDERAESEPELEGEDRFIILPKEPLGPLYNKPPLPEPIPEEEEEKESLLEDNAVVETMAPPEEDDGSEDMKEYRPSMDKTFAYTTWRATPKMKAIISDNKKIRYALERHLNYEEKKKIAKEATKELEVEEYRLREYQKKKDVEKISFQQGQVEKGWKKLTVTEKARDVAELTLHNIIATATDAERRQMIEEQKTYNLAQHREQDEITRATRVVKDEFQKMTNTVEEKKVIAMEMARQEMEGKKHGALGKARWKEQLDKSKKIEKENKKIEDEKYLKRGEKYVQLKNSTNKICSEIQASNEKKQRKIKKVLMDREKRKDLLLAENLNPYEAFRTEDRDAALNKKHAREEAARIHNNKDMKVIIKRDEKRQRNINKETEEKRLEAEKYQADFGPHTAEAKTKNYIVQSTGKEMIDPTGAEMTLDPSKYVVPEFGERMFKSQKLPDESLVEERKQKKIRAQAERISKEAHQEIDQADDFRDSEDEFEDENERAEREEEERRRLNTKIWEMKLSKFEVDMMAKARIRQKGNICQPQKCWSKEFQGDAFLIKPSVIEFRDFELNKKYKQTVEITNVSLTFNQFKLLPLEESIRDFFEIVLQPPGRMSAGITCTMVVSFFPKILNDINSTFPILAKTGPLNFPLRCITKKTILTITPQDPAACPLVDFGDVLAGEKNTVTLNIKNAGALPATYTLESLDPDGDQSFMEMIKIKKPKEIGPLTTTKIVFQFTPTELGVYSTVLRLHVDNHGGRDSNFEQTYDVIIKGSCVKVPIYVEKEEYDLKTIVIGHTYREAVTFRNRHNIAMKIQIEEPAVSSELNLSPLLAFIQANGVQVVSVKFCPQPDFLDRFPQYKTDVPGQFRIPIKLVGADQVLPVWTALVGTLTTNNIIFDPPSISFGSCTVGGSVLQQIKISNKSSLAQSFSFTRLPSYIRVEDIPKDVILEQLEDKDDTTITACQEGGGNGQVGTLLPHETIMVNLIYAPESATAMETTLSFKAHTHTVAREFPLKVRGQGKQPVLQFSATQIQMAVIPSEIATIKESIEVQNITNQPTRFSINVPPALLAQIYICPVCLLLGPKERARIQVEFKPTKEYVELLDIEDEPEEKTAEGEENQKGEAEAPVETPEGEEGEEAEPVPKKETAEEKRIKILRDMRTNGGRRWQKHDEGLIRALWKIPVSARQPGRKDCENAGQMNTATYPEALTTTIHMGIETSVVTPSLIAQPRQLLFGEITALRRSVLHVKLMNKTTEPQAVWTDPLPENACFTLINAPRTIVPGKPFQFSIAFRPLEAQMYKTILKIYTANTRVEVVLKGKGVRPVLQLDPPDGCINMGGIVSTTGDPTSVPSYVVREIYLENTSRYALSFSLKREVQAVSNCKGVPPFVLTPSTGSIPGKENDDDPPQRVPITITFRPHRPFEVYQERYHVVVANQSKESYLYIYGHSFRYSMYLTNFNEFGPFETLHSVSPFQDDLSIGMISKDPSILSPDQIANAEYSKAQRTDFNLTFDLETNEDVKMIVGQCTPQGYQGDLKAVPGAPAGTYEFQIPSDLQKMFSVEPAKGTVNPAQSTVISFKYHKADDPGALMCSGLELTPLKGVGQWIHCEVKCILSGGYTPAGEPANREFKVNLKAYLQQI